MSSQQHAEAIALWQAICQEAGTEAPFAVVVICALQHFLADLCEEHERPREPDERPARRYA